MLVSSYLTDPMNALLASLYETDEFDENKYVS